MSLSEKIKLIVERVSRVGGDVNDFNNEVAHDLRLSSASYRIKYLVDDLENIAEDVSKLEKHNEKKAIEYGAITDINTCFGFGCENEAECITALSHEYDHDLLNLLKKLSQQGWEYVCETNVTIMDCAHILRRGPKQLDFTDEFGELHVGYENLEMVFHFNQEKISGGYIEVLNNLAQQGWYLLGPFNNVYRSNSGAKCENLLFRKFNIE